MLHFWQPSRCHVLAAKFPSEQASLKSMQRNVRQSLPGGTKRNSIAISSSSIQLAPQSLLVFLTIFLTSLHWLTPADKLKPMKTHLLLHHGRKRSSKRQQNKHMTAGQQNLRGIWSISLHRRRRRYCTTERCNVTQGGWKLCEEKKSWNMSWHNNNPSLLRCRALLLEKIIKCCVQLGSYLRINQINGRGGDNLRSKFMQNILNFNETCLSLDGSSINRGGRPAVSYHDPPLPHAGMSTSKTSQTTTMITGGNAWGETLPPHFQFMTSAQTDLPHSPWCPMVRQPSRS